MLSFLLPGLGQIYIRREWRGLMLAALPLLAAVAFAGALLAFEPLMALVLRMSVAIATVAVVLVVAYHGAVIIDAFAGPTTRGRGLIGKHPADYLALGAVAALFIFVYVALFRQTTAWAALAERVFEPFHQSGPAADAPAWRGDERLNVLLLGVDTRPGDPATKNSDTMILLTVDPLNRAGGMLSIPRDTLVEIPGYGENKINAAYALGGADLARRTVSGFLDVPIHGYALIDFGGFKRVIDAVGGVVIDAPRPVRDEAYPTEDFGVTRISLRAGPQQMNGDVALLYARSRHGSNDFSRGERQQRVLTALKQRAAETGVPLRLPVLVGELTDAVRTDIDPGKALPLARLGADIDLRDIESRVLRPPTGDGGGELRELSSPAGYYLVPVRDRIREVVAELFYDPRVRQEAARVEIRAPDSRASVARSLEETLERRRYEISGIAPTSAQRGTRIVLIDASKRHTADELARLLGGTVIQGGVDADADIVVMLGDDFRGLATAR